MGAQESIFFDFNLPNATTWFYFSLLLAVALFFKFSRLLSMRNLDLVSLFLPVPGLLLLLDPHSEHTWGYVWLMGASGYLLVRCLLDLVLVRRPALRPNLDPGGLGWLAVALVVSLIAVAVKEPTRPRLHEHRNPPVTERVTRQVEQPFNRQDVPDAHIWAARALAVLCHLAVVAGLVVVGWRHFHDAHAGMAAATFYLLLPYTYLLLPHATELAGQWHHVWPMALMVWAVVAYRQPSIVGLLLGIAAGSVYFPLFVLPVWLSFYWRKGAGRCALTFVVGAGLCLAYLAMLAWLRGEGLHNLEAVLPMALRDWLPTWGEPAVSTPGLWKSAHWAYRWPVFVAYIALVLLTAMWPAPKNLAHVLALSAALLIGTQFLYADQGGVYVLWYLPLLLLLIFRPNLSDCQPPPIPPENDWLARARRVVGRLFASLLGLRRPTVKVQ
ncbi:MAG: hypothetical protein HYS12_04005 [Planctomycetes bacterium]|nr:hypothetical protein [Planctomycetota bacterium]